MFYPTAHKMRGGDPGLRPRRYLRHSVQHMPVDRSAAVRTWNNFIDGEWVPSRSGRQFESRNPADQDDLIGAAGANGFSPPAAIRSDQIIVRGVRLPFLKFPRSPNL